MGYSLIGVYPCAVWKPENNSSSAATTGITGTTGTTGPIRNCHRTTNRLAPYPPTQQTVQVQIPVQPSVVGIPQQQLTEPNQTTVNLAQPAQVVVASCSCKQNNNNQIAGSSTDIQATQSTPMLFVPFTVPSFAPPMAATALQTNCSPSKVNYVSM